MKWMPLSIALTMLLIGLPMRSAYAAPQVGTFDPTALLQGAQDVVRRAPDAAIDGLFHALHASVRDPQDAAALCGLFDPQADRSISRWNEVIAQLGADSQQRLVQALGEVMLGGLRNPPQPLDQAAATQALKSNGARAAMLYDGFGAGLAVDAAQPARCRSLGWMLDVLAARPQTERVQVARLLLSQGLTQALAAQAGGDAMPFTGPATAPPRK